jgi:hypothetical protein
MTPKRRSFLQLAGLAPAAAAGLVAPLAAHAVAAPSPLTRSAFAAHVGEDFAFQLDAFGSRNARLVSVEALQGARDAESSFRLLFRLPEKSAGLAQQTYRVDHPQMGQVTMFVSPNDAEGRIVEAIFNRL